MDTACSPGPVETPTKVNIRRTSEMDMARCDGQTAARIKVNGKEGSNMDMEK